MAGGSKSGGSGKGTGGGRKGPRRNAKGQGRKRKPTEVKRRAGNPGQRPLNEREPEFGNVVEFPQRGKGGKDTASKGTRAAGKNAGGKDASGTGKEGRPRSRQGGRKAQADKGVWVPEELADDPVAVAHWQVLFPQLARQGIVQRTDVNVLVGACQAWSLAQHARYLMLSTGGPVLEEPITNKEGDVVGHRRKRHPAAIQYKEAMMLYRAYASEIGLTPSARSGLEVPGREDPDEELFS